MAYHPLLTKIRRISRSNTKQDSPPAFLLPSFVVHLPLRSSLSFSNNPHPLPRIRFQPSSSTLNGHHLSGTRNPSSSPKPKTRRAHVSERSVSSSTSFFSSSSHVLDGSRARKRGSFTTTTTSRTQGLEEVLRNQKPNEGEGEADLELNSTFKDPPSSLNMLDELPQAGRGSHGADTTLWMLGTRTGIKRSSAACDFEGTDETRPPSHLDSLSLLPTLQIPSKNSPGHQKYYPTALSSITTLDTSTPQLVRARS